MHASEKREAYLDAVLADWPPFTPEQQNVIATLLGSPKDEWDV